MQPTELQVERSLAALRDAPAELEAVTGEVRGSSDRRHDEVPEGLASALALSPDVRADRLEEARRRLASGEVPSDADLAGRMVGRIVCDRLR